MNDPLLSVIKNHGGFVSTEIYNAVATSFPNLTVGVKMGCSARFACPIKDAHARVAALEKANPADYCREIFVPVNVLDSLRAALGMGRDIY